MGFMGMSGRPVEGGGKTKLRVNISVDPDEWEKFRQLLADKLPEATASSHIQDFVRQEIKRLSGEKTVNVVDVAGLQKRFAGYKKRYMIIQKNLFDRKAVDRFQKLMDAYGLDVEHFSNSKEVICKALTDRKKKDTPTPIQVFLEDAPSETDVSLFISILEIRAEMDKITKKLLDAQVARYLPPSPTQESAATDKEQGEGKTPEETNMAGDHTHDTKPPPTDTASKERGATSDQTPPATPEEEEDDPDYWEESDETEWVVDEKEDREW